MAIIHVLGNLTRAPELREAGSSQVCSFRVAENTFARGEKVAQFFDVSVWGKRGETASQHLDKGSSVLVHGSFTVREYEHNGEQRHSLEIGNADWQFAGGKGESSGASDAATDDNDDSDIPF